MINYHFPKSFPRAEEITAKVNNEIVEVLSTNIGYIISVAYEGAAELEIEAVKPIKEVSISPFCLELKADIIHEKVSIHIPGNEYLYIEIEGISRPLFFYGNKVTEYNEAEATYYFKAGQIYEVGNLILKSNESVYIEGGAVVSGGIRAFGASGIRVYGHGILDGSYFKDIDREHRTILLDKCTDTVIKDIILIKPSCWMIMIAGCNGIRIDNVKEIGEVISSDGVDIVGSSNVVIENCIFRNNDDSIAIKAFEETFRECNEPGGWNNTISGIEVRHCIFINGGGGNVVEIGHELQTEEVGDILFYDIDIVCVKSYGAALAIHAGDRATVRDITYENIRIQHYYDKLLDFRVMRSMYNKDEERGQIRNIRLKNIRVKESIYNPGYSISLIGGYDEAHTVENVTFEDFYLNERKVWNADQLDLHMKNAKNICFI